MLIELISKSNLMVPYLHLLGLHHLKSSQLSLLVHVKEKRRGRFCG
jgi:hypothetical protein